jgi:putative endonuclease
MGNQKQRLGRWGETVAAEFLIQKGYQVLHRNERTAFGEIDLVARQNRVTVFVEVKTRSNLNYGYPEEAITHQKRHHMIASALAYLGAHPELAGDWRLDVIAIQGRKGGPPPEIVHYENAVTA